MEEETITEADAILPEVSVSCEELQVDSGAPNY